MSSYEPPDEPWPERENRASATVMLSAIVVPGGVPGGSRHATGGVLGYTVASPTAAAFDPVDPGKLLSAASADSLTDLAISTAPVPLANS